MDYYSGGQIRLITKMSGGIPYLGSKISLISKKSEIRYEGILYTIDPNESLVCLAKVNLFGTENRHTDRPVAPSDEVYEYIIFRGPDIKEIQVCEPPKPSPQPRQQSLPQDPAIVQSSQTVNSQADLSAQNSPGANSNSSPSYPPQQNASKQGEEPDQQQDQQTSVSPMATPPYLGSKICLISKTEIRYEGILYTIDPDESTLCLAKVKSFGTEDRHTDHPVPPCDDVYEYTIFRGSEIKEVQVSEPPKRTPLPRPQSLPRDPAIVQSFQTVKSQADLPAQNSLGANFNSSPSYPPKQNTSLQGASQQAETPGQK